MEVAVCNAISETMPEAIDSCESVEMKKDSHKLLHDEMLNYLASSKEAHFKSQQVGEPELHFEHKRQIALDVLTHSPSQFLSRFGHHLLESHLDYFTDEEMKNECYEVDFHVNRLRRFHCKAKNQVDVKNRRFEALKKLVSEGSYFSENEMMKRNPLLYDQLIGQYLTRKEIKEREKEDKAECERSYVSHLLHQMEQDDVNCLRKLQQDYEEAATEEVDTSDEEEEEEEEEEVNDEASSEDEGEEEDDEMEDDVGEETEQKPSQYSCLKKKRLTATEKSLLRDEFISNMYHCFLEGKDTDFDYSKVDLNPEFECLAVRSQDEEEKYFDSETPELVAPEQNSAGEEEEEEDELDKFMKNLKPEPTPNELAKDMNNL